MPPKTRSSYQHGHLPQALGEAVLELIGERGVRGFTLAEAARRSGVSVSAPYRHYSDREALLAAVAVQAYGVLQRRLAAAKTKTPEPIVQICAMAAAYVRFARDDRPRFELLFESGLDKAAHPDLAIAADAAYEQFLASVVSACASREDMVPSLAMAVRACAHGYAALMLDGSLEQSGVTKRLAPAVAGRAVHHLVDAFLRNEELQAASFTATSGGSP